MQIFQFIFWLFIFLPNNGFRYVLRELILTSFQSWPNHMINDYVYVHD